ncbi:MAG: hypothetical protein U5R31_03985 [Acidimicrobiia bacterium]|nr:hypothetical protein [Acidimicrobiia bacterium]
MEKSLKNLAQRILEQKSEKFTLENKKNISHILDPLKERLNSFETKIEKTNTDFLKGHSQLGVAVEASKRAKLEDF